MTVMKMLSRKKKKKVVMTCLFNTLEFHSTLRQLSISVACVLLQSLNK